MGRSLRTERHDQVARSRIRLDKGRGLLGDRDRVADDCGFRTLRRSVARSLQPQNGFDRGDAAHGLIFLPVLAWPVVHSGWREMTVVLGIAVLVTLIPILLLMRNDPEEIGLTALGATEPVVVSVRPSSAAVIKRASRVPEF